MLVEVLGIIDWVIDQIHNRISVIWLIMVHWALKLFLAWTSIWTFMGLIIVRVVVLLLPSMRMLTLFLQWTSLKVVTDERTWFPVRTEVTIVLKQMRLPPEILPIMCVHTLCLIVFMCEGTPFCFELIQVESLILLPGMNNVDLDLISRVSEWTELLILTVMQIMGEVGAELGFILMGMVEPLHVIMTEMAIVNAGLCVLEFA